MKLTLSLLLPTLALALPTSSTGDNDEACQEYKWHVSGWTAGCARSGCYYDFNVTGQAQPVPKDQKGVYTGVSPPAFLAYCSGQQDWFRQCKILSSGCDGVNDKGCSVSARLFPDDSDPTNATIGVSYSWTHKQDESNYPTYNFTGYAQSIFNQFAAPAQEFDVVPSQATAVL